MTGKPTWSKQEGLGRVGFFRPREPLHLDPSTPTMAQQIAQAAAAFELQRSGHGPKSVTVVMSGDTLVITLHGALSPAETALAQNPKGAARLQEYHRQLFAEASDTLRQEIKRISGVEVREAAAEVEPKTGAVVEVFNSGTIVQVFLLADKVATDVWSDGGQAGGGMT